jgi:hypothetical protein
MGDDIVHVSADVLERDGVAKWLSGKQIMALSKTDTGLTQEQRIKIRKCVEQAGTDSAKKAFENKSISHMWF